MVGSAAAARGKLLPLCLVLCLVLCSCPGSPADLPEPEGGENPATEEAGIRWQAVRPGAEPFQELETEPLPQAEGPYAFGLDGKYGLVDTEGNLLMPLEQPWLAPVRYGAAPDERFFEAGVYYDNPNVMGPSFRLALVSPRGDILTGHDYYYFRWVEDQTFAALRQLDPPVCVLLDSQGNEEEAVDPELVESLVEEARRLNTVDYYAESQEQPEIIGPDVPKGGFVHTVELGDGTFWGAYRTDRAELVYERFDRSGKRVGSRRYSSLYRMEGNVWLATLPDSGDTGGNLFISPQGEPLEEGRYYDRAYTYNYVVWGDQTLFLTGLGDAAQIRRVDAPLEVLGEIPLEEGYSGRLVVLEDRQLFILEAEERDSGLSPVVYDLDAWERIDFSLYPQGEIRSFSRDGSRLVLSYYLPADPDKPGQRRYREALTDRYGHPILAGADQITAMIGYYLVWDYHNYGSLCGLYDKNGVQILPVEYQSIELVHDSTALRVVRGDWAGIMDFQGNWIYRQSLYTGLEE